MKYFTILLALLTATIYASDPPVSEQRWDDLVGHWYEPYDDAQLEIRYHRRGLKVREIKRNRRKGWDIYEYRGRGLYDNCRGRTIRVLGRDEIRWKKTWTRSKYMVKDRPYGRRGYSYNDYRSRSRTRYRDDYCGPGDYRSRNRNRRDRYADYDRRYDGDWYCQEEDLGLRIEIYGAGIRARRPGRDWVYYDGDRRSGYRDDRGNRYFFDDDGFLCWQTRDGRRTHRFRRR